MSTFEQALVGCLLNNPDRIEQVKMLLAPVDFEDEFLRNVYAAMSDMHERGDLIDLICLANHMQPKNLSTDMHAALMLFALENKIDVDVSYYSKKIIEDRKYRELSMFAQLINTYIVEKKPLVNILDYMRNLADELYKDVEVPKGHELAELWMNIAKDKDEQLDGKKILKIYTHYAALDKYLEGFREGNLVTIAAPSGVGKTTFGLNLLKNVSNIDKIPVMLLSLEMSANEIGVSVLSSYSGCPQSKIKSDEIEDRMTTLEIAATAGIDLINKGIKFKIYCENLEKFGNAIRTIRAHMKAVPDCKFIMIDYPALMETDDQSKNKIRAYEIGYMTRTLKNLAMELKIVILILAQTNRRVGDIATKMPTLNDLRDSSSFAHDSNVVMFIHCEPNVHDAKIIIAKNRNGPTGIVDIGYNRAIATFLNIDGSEYTGHKAFA